MSGLILCPECSNNLGEVQMFINIVKKGFIDFSVKNNPKIKNYAPSKLKMNPGIIPPIGFILDAAQLRLICCRTHAMTVVENNVVYH